MNLIRIMYSLLVKKPHCKKSGRAEKGGRENSLKTVGELDLTEIERVL